MNLIDADKSADLIIAELEPLCLLHQPTGQRYCKKAGSIRRKKPDMIKDIEIVAIPDTSKAFEIRALVNSRWGVPSMGAFPSKYTKIRGAYDIDFFWPNLQTWGLIYFIRTGSAEFAARALARWKKITNGGYAKEGQLHLPDGTIHPTPTEMSVFKALKMEFVPPEKRF